MRAGYLLLIEVNDYIDTIIDHELKLFFVDLGLPKYSAIDEHDVIESVGGFIDEFNLILKNNNIKTNGYK